MSKYHVAVVGSRPLKNGNRNAPFSQENLEFVSSVLRRVNKEDYASISHGATDYGVDSVAEFFAMRQEIKQKQFPSYWFDPTKEKNIDKAAALKSREAMIRSLSDSVHNKTDEYAMLLIFHTQENPNQDETLKSLLDFVAKYHPKIQVRTFRLPVVENPKQSEQVELNLNSQPVAIPDPFTVPSNPIP